MTDAGNVVVRASAALAAAGDALGALRADARCVLETSRDRGARLPALTALGDTSLWVVTLLRTSTAVRALFGTSLGLSRVLRLGFHVDVWTAAIGPGLRLPHPFNIVVGEGVEIGSGCTLMHNVTIQHGLGTRIGDRVMLGNGVTVLTGSTVGAGAMIGAGSVVHGQVDAGVVAVGSPARAIRRVRAGE